MRIAEAGATAAERLGGRGRILTGHPRKIGSGGDGPRDCARHTPPSHHGQTSPQHSTATPRPAVPAVSSTAGTHRHSEWEWSRWTLVARCAVLRTSHSILRTIMLSLLQPPPPRPPLAPLPPLPACGTHTHTAATTTRHTPPTRPPLWRKARRATLPERAAPEDKPTHASSRSAQLLRRLCTGACMTTMGAECSMQHGGESSVASSVPSTNPASANRRATAMDDGHFPPAAGNASSSTAQSVTSQTGVVALRQVGLSVDGEEGRREHPHAEHSRSLSQGVSSRSRSSTSVQAWKTKIAAESTTPTQPKRSILPGLGPATSSAPSIASPTNMDPNRSASTSTATGIASPTNVDPIVSRSASSCASRLSNRSSGGSGSSEDHALLLPSATMRLQGPAGSVSPLEVSAGSSVGGNGGSAAKDLPVIRSVEMKHRRIALVASGRNQSPFASHARTNSAIVLPRSGTTTPPSNGASTATSSIAASASIVVAAKTNVPAQVASAPLQTRRLNPALVERAHLSVHGGGTHSRNHSSQAGSIGQGSCMVGADEVPLGYTHTVDPSPGSSACASTAASAVSSVALVAAAAPTLGADVVSAETTRSLNAYLAAPKLMTAEEYRSTYPAFDAHNADYMAYRARWELAEREATASAQNAPGSKPRASSRSLLCTPKNAPRSLSVATTTPGSGVSVHSSPLSGLRVLTPTLHGAFGYGALSPDDPVGAGGIGGVSGSPLQSASASLYLPPPSFVDGDVPTDFVHKHSVMAFMVESSRPSSLRSTPLKGFVSVAREGACGATGAGSLMGSPMTANKRLVLGDSSLLSPGMLVDPELLLPSPQASTSSPDASLVYRELMAAKADADESTPYSPLAGSFKPKLFTSSMQAQKSPLLASEPASDAFVPVLPSTHMVQDPESSSLPSAKDASFSAVGLTSVSPAPSAAAISAAASAMIAGAAVRISPSSSAASAEVRRCFSDGIATRRLNAAQLELQKRILAGSDDSGATLSPSTASPVASVAATTQSVSAASTLRPSRRRISAGGSQSPSLPGTPLEADDLAIPAAATVSVSAAVMRSQAHISAITKSWQERLGVGSGAGEAGTAEVTNHASTSLSFLPSVNLDRSSPGHSRVPSQTSVNSPRLSEDPRYASASASVARKLALPAGSRLRAVKCMLPSDRAMTESTPVSLPPAHSPASAVNKRRLRLNSGGTLVPSPLGAADGVQSPLPTPSPTAAGAAAAAAAASSSLGGSSSGLGLAPNAVTPSPTTRRRLLLQVPAATSSPVAPLSGTAAGASGGGIVYSFAQIPSASQLPAITTATSATTSGFNTACASLAEPNSAPYHSSSTCSSTLSSPIGSTNSTPSSGHRRMLSAGGQGGMAVQASASGHA